MKKLLLILAMITLISVPALAEAETILSLGMGANTGLIGFTLERMVNSHSAYLGFGVGILENLKFSAGYRYYLPDTHSDRNTRSNIFISPSVGLNLNPNTTWDAEHATYIYKGYLLNAWGGLTMGYDHRWGNAKQYRFTLEGGFAYDNNNELIPLPLGLVPIMSFSLGYVF